MATPLKRKANESLASDTGKASKTTHNTSITSFFGAPKSSPSEKAANGQTNGAAAGVASSAALKFDKEKWVSTLSPEVKGLLKLEIDTLDVSYLAVKEIRDELVTKEFLDLKRFLKNEIEVQKKKVFPPLSEVYSWSRHTPLHTVKVVIIGQDPYHNHNQAHGLCFSVRPPTPPPPSLKNIYIALQKDYPDFQPPPKPNTGLLTPWAERGVLMLNTCLTVRAHEANSHSSRGWERFTQKVIDIVAKTRSRGVVFLAWGTPAAKRVAKVDRKKHNILQAVHPSPLSAHRGFFDCGHFRKTNDWLAQRYTIDGIIDWNLSGKPAPISEAPVAKPTESAAEAIGKTTNVVAKETENTKPAPAKSNGFDEDLDDDDAIDALNEIVADEAAKAASQATQEPDEAEPVEKNDASPSAANGANGTNDEVKEA